MIKKNDQPAEQTFIIKVVPINEHITTDNLESKLRLMMGACGLKSVDVESVEGQDDEPEAGLILL